jgi:uncharacterized membrane protein
MNATIGIYENHDKAVDAVKELQKANYPVSKISIIGQAGEVDDHMHLKGSSPVAVAETSIGVVAGSVVGLLTGLGIFAIPGLGFLYGAGAIVGLIAGVDFGLIGGGLTAIFTAIGVDAEKAREYKKLLADGKFMLVAHGSNEEVKQAEDILESHGMHEMLHGGVANQAA